MDNKIIRKFKGFEGYLAIAGLGLIIIYVINYAGVEYLNLKPQVTYFVALTINYVIAYFGNARIFKQGVNKRNLVKFIVNSIIFFILNNYLFYIFITYLSIHYLTAIAINFIIFPIIKFFSYKLFVFKSNEARNIS